MDIPKIVKDLLAEKRALDEAIDALELLAKKRQLSTITKSKPRGESRKRTDPN